MSKIWQCCQFRNFFGGGGGGGAGEGVRGGNSFIVGCHMITSYC